MPDLLVRSLIVPFAPGIIQFKVVHVQTCAARHEACSRYRTADHRDSKIMGPAFLCRSVPKSGVRRKHPMRLLISCKFDYRTGDGDSNPEIAHAN